MSADRLFRAYINVCWVRESTDEQRREAFDAWWKPEKADAMATKKAEQKATKREQAKALRA